MNPKTEAHNRYERLRASEKQQAGKRVVLMVGNVAQPPLPAPHLIAAIDRLCARALAAREEWLA